jgi:predicted DNA-binding protein
MKEDMKLCTWALKDERSYKEVINIRLPWRAKKLLGEIAKSKGMTLSDFVRLCIERALEEELNKT